MKITHNDTGTQYQLSPGTELEIERTNPFFNDFGEQSLPVDLPDTDINRILTGQPQDPGNRKKASKRILVKVEDEDYVMQCRQAILSAQDKEPISTSFYMNEGSFYDTMPDTTLRVMFGNETVDGITTVAQGIAFCQSLLLTTDERFDIFPILIDGEDSAKKYINQLAWMDASGNEIIDRLLISDHGTTPPGLYNSFIRTETISAATITLPAGYYISPFIKVNYLLKRIFQHFGYTLLDNFFTQNEPFRSMVFLNNTVDTLATGIIKIADIVPDCTCGTILDIFRKKFNCEFIPDELTSSVKIVLMNDVLSSDISVDLTSKITSRIRIEYPDTYKQLKLSSSQSITDSQDNLGTFSDINTFLSGYPTSVLNRSDQCFYRKGYQLGTVSINKVATSSIPYQASETLEVKEISVPDSQPIMVASSAVGGTHSAGVRYGNDYVPMLYIGRGIYRNSSIKYDQSTDDSSETSTSTETSEQLPMLAFSYDGTGHGYRLGTISNYNYLGTTRLWDFSLCYFGGDGIFERFYRKYDNMLRNTLHTVKVNLLLTNLQKRTIPAHEKIIMHGQEYFINSLKYKIGGSNDPEESDFFTIRLYEPIDLAEDESTRVALPTYKWSVISSYVTITESEYNSSEFKDKSYAILYPPHPVALGGTFYTQKIAKSVVIIRETYYRLYTYNLTGVAY